MKKVAYLMSRSFAGEKTPAKASFLLTLKEDQQGRKLNVFAQDLSNGMYSYTLVVDGKLIDTKRW
ncbi:MAG: hypothetical protein WCP52_10200 [Bacteroidota bacterium]